MLYLKIIHFSVAHDLEMCNYLYETSQRALELNDLNQAKNTFLYLVKLGNFT